MRGGCADSSENQRLRLLFVGGFVLTSGLILGGLHRKACCTSLGILLRFLEYNARDMNEIQLAEREGAQGEQIRFFTPPAILYCTSMYVLRNSNTVPGPTK